MIIFATNHDDSTAESIEIAQLIIEENDIFLLNENAVKLNLLSILKTNPYQSLMIFSHGERNFCIGNDDLPALTNNDIPVLKNRKVYAYACWTAVELGKQACIESNCLYAGYNNTIVTGGSDILIEMQTIFQFIKHELFATQNQNSIIIFLDTLGQLCTNVEQAYLQRYPETLNYIGISTMLRNIWAKLEIWFTNQKYTHPEAIEPPLW